MTQELIAADSNCFLLFSEKLWPFKIKITFSSAKISDLVKALFPTEANKESLIAALVSGMYKHVSIIKRIIFFILITDSQKKEFLLDQMEQRLF